MFVTATQQLPALKRIERAHVELMAHKDTMEYASIIMVGKYTVIEGLPTACTDGIDCMYGKDFVGNLPDNELRGLIMHENLHKTFQHTFLWKHLYEENAKCANMACDYVINLLIKDIDTASSGFVRLPKVGLLDERFRDMNSQEVFKILMDEGKGQGQGDGDGEGAGLDDHNWDTSGMTQQEIEEHVKEVNQAIRQGQLMAGKMGGNQSRELGELLEPKVDWREQLRDYINSLADGKDISTWQKVNRRWLQHDMYMPSTLSESMGRIVIAIDTSGSIGGEALNEFLSEVQAICINIQPELIDLLYWDTEVAAHEVYGREELGNLVKSTKPAGGGGTDPACIPAYIQDKGLKPECVVVLTDGYVGGWGTWAHPVLWAITGGYKPRPTTGTAIYID
jgi:predicted metal-dependent peptidase